MYIVAAGPDGLMVVDQHNAHERVLYDKFKEIDRMSRIPSASPEVGVIRTYVDWLIAKGVHGLYPNGSTGEFVRFTPEERRRIIQIVCQQAAAKWKKR